MITLYVEGVLSDLAKHPTSLLCPLLQIFELFESFHRLDAGLNHPPHQQITEPERTQDPQSHHGHWLVHWTQNYEGAKNLNCIIITSLRAVDPGPGFSGLTILTSLQR